jgi:hypothetical protein
MEMTRQVSWVCALSTQEEKAKLFKTIKENKFAHFRQRFSIRKILLS